MSADIVVSVNGAVTHRIHLRNLGAPPGVAWEEEGERLYEWTLGAPEGISGGTVTHVRSEGMMKLISIICAAASGVLQ